jgi:hypothetical protein
VACCAAVVMGVPDAPVERLGRWGVLGERDTVEIGGRRYRVRGWIAYDDEWVEYLLDDGRWLCIEDEGGLRFSLWEDQDTTWQPPDGLTFTWQGVEYHRLEHYTSRWLAAGVEGLTGPGQVTVTDYAGPGGALAAVENWGDGPELSLGRQLGPADVRL